MSYGNERYGGGDDGNYGGDEYGNNDNRRGHGGQGGRQEYGNSQSEFGGQGYDSQGGGGYGQGNSEYGGQSGYDERRDELRQHGQSGYGLVFSSKSNTYLANCLL